MKFSKKILIALLLLTLASIIAYNYIYKDHRSIADEAPSFVIKSSEVLNEFSKNIAKAEMKYLDKTIEISGNITQINENNLTIDEVVFCILLDESNTPFLVNDKITVKGRCIGYDDLLEQIKLDQCTINYQ